MVVVKFSVHVVRVGNGAVVEILEVVVWLVDELINLLVVPIVVFMVVVIVGRLVGPVTGSCCFLLPMVAKPPLFSGSLSDVIVTMNE